MPDQRKHRGPHPDDERLFEMCAWPSLRRAVDELSWLLSRNYAHVSALKLVGDRYALDARQRVAVARCAAGDFAVAERRSRQVAPATLRGKTLWVDGYNVLTTIEAALAGGVILVGRDGAYRDMASMHGSYRKVSETVPALEILGSVLAAWGVSRCSWYLDRPVSNSGRLKQIMEGLAQQHGWSWQIELVADPDKVLVAAAANAQASIVVASADSVVLAHCGAWFNLAGEAIACRIPQARVLALG